MTHTNKIAEYIKLAEAAKVSRDVLKHNFKLGLQDVLAKQNLPAQDMAGLIEVMRDGTLDKIADAIVDCIEALPAMAKALIEAEEALNDYGTDDAQLERRDKALSTIQKLKEMP